MPPVCMLRIGVFLQWYERHSNTYINTHTLSLSLVSLLYSFLSFLSFFFIHYSLYLLFYLNIVVPPFDHLPISIISTTFHSYTFFIFTLIFPPSSFLNLFLPLSLLPSFLCILQTLILLFSFIFPLISLRFFLYLLLSSPFPPSPVSLNLFAGKYHILWTPTVCEFTFSHTMADEYLI